MLILTRRIGESLRITIPNTHYEIDVHIAGINGSQVKVAVNAPAECNVVRSELLKEKIHD